MIVFVATKDSKLKKDMDAIEKTVLKDERVALGTRLIECVRLDADIIDPKHPLFALVTGKALPRMAGISRDRSAVEVLDGKVKASNLYNAMKKVSGVDYETRIDTYVADMRNLLNDLDKVDQQAKKLAADKKRGKADQADLDELEEQKKELEERQKELAEVKLKPLGGKK